MSTLWIHDDEVRGRAPRVFTEAAAIAEALGARGVRFEQWPARRELAPGASDEAVLAAYAAEVSRLRAEGPYPKVDVVRLRRDPADLAWSEKARAARAKFLDEHTHAEDEVRFFVEGQGAFYLRLAGAVHVVMCTRGDLLSVPAGTRHWFDMGPEPAFAAIRFFGTEAGWVARFTGDAVARTYPAYEALT